MRKTIVLLATITLFLACSSSETKKASTADTSVSSAADSIRNAVENSLKDTVLNPTDSVRGVDSIRK